MLNQTWQWGEVELVVVILQSPFSDLLLLKARERTCEQTAAQTNSELQQEISRLTCQLNDLQMQLSSAHSQQSQHVKVLRWFSLLFIFCIC